MFFLAPDRHPRNGSRGSLFVLCRCVVSCCLWLAICWRSCEGHLNFPHGINKVFISSFFTMKFQKKGMKVSGKVVYDLESLFARLLVVGGQRKMELSSLFKYEFSPVPLSIIDDNGMTFTESAKGPHH